VKHEKSRRPSSWKQEKITRSFDEAMELIRSQTCNLIILSCVIFGIFSVQITGLKLSQERRHLQSLPLQRVTVVAPEREEI
jgi:hypothetical protein